MRLYRFEATRLRHAKRNAQFNVGLKWNLKKLRSHIGKLLRLLRRLLARRSNETEKLEGETEIGETSPEKNDSLLLGPRWAVAAPTTDLSGVWKPIVTPAFKKEYDEYMQSCGEGIFLRKAMVSVIGLAREVIDQRNDGRELSITGTTPIGNWKRVLVASGAEKGKNHGNNFEPVYTQFKDPDGDMVQVEAWWENDGSVHKSWLRNKPRVMGGEFESTRYLESENILVCESVFHPSPENPKFQPAKVVWRFQRQ
jgi:hypothetical protein